MTAFGFVGAGNMARALGAGLRGASFPSGPIRLLATDPDRGALERFTRETGGGVAADLGALLGAAEVVILAVKPQVLTALLPDIARGLAPRHLVISIAAGATLAALERGLGAGARVIRAMPNTPALVRRGITVLVAASAATALDVETAERIFRAAGDVIVMEDEGLMDAVTAVSGSGPGFFFAYAEAMLAAAEAVGLEPEVALRLVQSTLVGSAHLWLDSGESAARLRTMVTSPGGTTEAGLAALGAHGFAAAARAAVVAAAQRSRELSAD
jgi:pyrroline-5-carboxylate reductase